MEERTTSQEEQQLTQHDLLSEWLGETRYAAGLIVQMDDALAILCGKRTTLEEKIIAREFNRLVAAYGQILTVVHELLAAQSQPPVAALEKLRTLNFNVHEETRRFLKALNYNLNYVEQYFEFNFSNRLVEEWQFAEQAHSIVRLLQV